MANATIGVGDTIHLTCNSSDNQATVKWIKTDGGDIPGRAMIVNDLNLIIQNLQPVDFGFYTCVFFNANGFSAPASVGVGLGE